MKKVLPIFVVLVLILNGLVVVATSEKRIETKNNEIKQTLSFEKPIVKDTGDFITVNLQDTDTMLRYPGAPELPMKVEVYYLPFGIQDVQVSFTQSIIHEQLVSKDIIPSAEAVPLTYGKTIGIEPEKSVEIYSSVYPKTWYDFKVGCGLNPENNEHSTIVSLRVFPIRYSREEGKIFYIENADISINYNMPENPVTFSSNEYDMVIIAPKEFSFALQRLIKHKDNHGVKTTLKTVEDIYTEYDGFDKPEEVKLFIKDAIEQWNITYVLLVGGLNNYEYAEDKDNQNEGSTYWHVPVRYTNLYDDYNPEKPPSWNNVYDPGAISDLYYADVYKEGGVFEDWDSNDDGVMAAFGRNATPDDVLDLFPDVYVGRLACRNALEVMLIVNKIVNYEKKAASSYWFNKMVCIAGDSFHGYGCEGENTCNASLEYMTGFRPVKVYASNQDKGIFAPTPTVEKITRAISRGSGFLQFEGHGNPAVWATHWPDSDEWTPKYDVYNFTRLRNGQKLPVCIVGGCHNSQINVTLNKTESGPDVAGYWTHGLPIPECFSWWMTRKIFGGSIATIGMTGLGYGLVGSSNPIGLGAYMDLLFFWAYGDQEEHVLGETCGAALNRYVSEIPTHGDGKTDTKTVQSWLLLGDPSLMIGGYN